MNQAQITKQISFVRSANKTMLAMDRYDAIKIKYDLLKEEMPLTAYDVITKQKKIKITTDIIELMNINIKTYTKELYTSAKEFNDSIKQFNEFDISDCSNAQNTTSFIKASIDVLEFATEGSLHEKSNVNLTIQNIGELVVELKKSIETKELTGQVLIRTIKLIFILGFTDPELDETLDQLRSLSIGIIKEFTEKRFI